jgi:hypothetical protein
MSLEPIQIQLRDLICCTLGIRHLGRHKISSSNVVQTFEQLSFSRYLERILRDQFWFRRRHIQHEKTTAPDQNHDCQRENASVQDSFSKAHARSIYLDEVIDVKRLSGREISSELASYVFEAGVDALDRVCCIDVLSDKIWILKER